MPRIARILVDLSLDRHFDYLVPARLEHEVRIGTHVTVPFGKRTIRGCVVDFPEVSPHADLKEIENVCSKRPRISPKLVELGAWMAEYYCCSREHAIRALLPGAVRSGKISKKTQRCLFIPDLKKAQDYMLTACARSPARAELLKTLLQHHGVPLAQVKKEAGVSDAVINALVKAGIISKEDRRVERDPFADAVILKSVELELTDEQTVVLASIREMATRRVKQFVGLLHGVTSSGKTEVYLRAIAETLKDGKDSIVLVPEISLTPQTTERFRARFGNLVSVLHSGLGDGERFDEWTKINEGRVRIVVGARSALFAPFKNLGLIVVDEEHENSYKQDEAPRYHARDVAVMRAKMEGAVAILGSATPSLESYHNAGKGKYLLLRLTKRIDDRVMPAVRIVDMRLETAALGRAQIFSRDLTEAIRSRIERAEQTIIFLNRRGFATHLSCSMCGYTAVCQECSVNYTFHRERECLSCHLCGSLLPAPSKCPQCGNPEIRYGGVGTEKVEAIAAKLFPAARIRRMDSDTMTHRKCYEKVLHEFRRGDIDILVGTQMIAKGLHFPNVTLVGIINADTGLHMPDFRAEERVFQLLTQVAGRAGRGEVKGEVFIQTYSPFNPAIQRAVTHDYEGFYADEMLIRKELSYPPVGHLVTFRFSGESEPEVKTTSEEFESRLKARMSPNIIVSPASPAPIQKIKNRFRYCLIIRGPVDASIRKTISEMVLRSPKPKNVDIYADVDALNLM